MNRIPLEVRDYMTSDPITVSPTTDIAHVVRLLIEHDLSGLIVVDDANTVLGVVTERDCIAAATSADYYGEWGGPVAKYMSSSVECVAPGENLLDIAERMVASRFRRFPVVERGQLVGLLTRRDVMRALVEGSQREL
jgi:CBS domain-containing protein